MTELRRPIERDGTTRAAGPDALAEREEERSFLLRSITDLERERRAGDIDDADYETLRDGYTARAATVLRAIEDGRAALPSTTPSRRRRVVLGIALTLAVAVGAGIVVAQSAGQRLPGQSVSGGQPDDGSVGSLLAQARALGFSDLPGAQALYAQVLAREPKNVEALTYLGWLSVLETAQQSQAGTLSTDEVSTSLRNSLTLIRQATVLDPTYADAHCFLGITFFRFLDDPASAKPEIDICQASNPPAQVKDLVASLAQRIDEALDTVP